MPKDRPVQTFRRANVEAAIWKNETENGVFYNVTFSKSYREKDSEELKNSSSFGRDDLLRVARVSDLAEAWLYEQNES